MDNRLYSTECSTADYIRNKNVFSIRYYYEKISVFNLLNFRNSHNYLFISKYSSDHHNHLNNFIKIGMGYLTRSNVIIEIIAKNKEGTF